jgi:hypothetical protein
MVAFADQAGDVAFSSMERDARHGHPLAFGHISARQHDFQLPRHEFCVGVEGLVKIAQPEEHNDARILALDIEVLLADGSDIFFRHTDDSK